MLTEVLSDTDGRIVIVFAHKSPEAWETLVKAMIESGLVVTASWPIDTEMQGGLNEYTKAVLHLQLRFGLSAENVPTNAKNGRYSEVKRKMQERITERLRYFWDQDIRGPDFVWAAIGPALESYSSHKEVKRMDGQTLHCNRISHRSAADGDRLRLGTNSTRHQHRGTGRVDALLPDAQGLFQDRERTR